MVVSASSDERDLALEFVRAGHDHADRPGPSAADSAPSPYEDFGVEQGELELDLGRATEILASLPQRVTSIHLSGLRTAADVRNVAATAAHAALVGEALMRLDDPEKLLTELVRAAG